MNTRSMVIVTAALAIAPSFARADAPSTGLVVLKDGTIVHGEIVELVTGDHVVVNVDGVPKTFPWAAVATVLAGSSSATTTTTTTTGTPDAWARVGGSLFDLHASRNDGPLVDWPEPDRSPPNIMTSRLSIGIEGGLGGVPVGPYAFAAEYYPWTWGGLLQIGLHGAFGPNGFVGPTVSEMLTFDWSYGSFIQQGLGIGLAHSFRSTMSSLPGAPDRVDVVDADVGHFSVFFTRRVMLRVMFGLEFPLTAGCDDTGRLCGNTSTIYGLASMMWNFDTSRGDQ